MSEVVLKALDLRKSYTDATGCLTILDGVNLEVYKGQCVAIVGASGSGKSTLLQCLGGLDSFDEGEVWIGSEKLSSLSESQRTEVRNKKLGFVYQFHHLLSEFSALENVAMTLKIRRVDTDKIQKQSMKVLEAMGLKDRFFHFPGTLSGGERQRVAIARAVVGDPLCLLADEPTGNLDSTTADAVFNYLRALCSSWGLAVVIVTHDADIASRCDKVLRLKNGKLEDVDKSMD